MADHIPHAEFVALDSDVDLICVSDVIDEMAHEIGAFIHRTVHLPDSTGWIDRVRAASA